MEVLLVLLIGGWVVFSTRARLRDLEEQLRSALRRGDPEELDTQVRGLTARVHALEEQLRVAKGRPVEERAPQPAPRPAPRPVPPPAVPTPPASPVIPAPVIEIPRPETAHMPVPSFAIPTAPAAPGWTARVQSRLAGGEWEALVGGSLLNKAGALVLVIGISLFLAYSLMQLSPAGRVATALAVSLALIAGGLFVERKRDYRVFGAGLLGAGWAGLYATVFAAHAVPAAKVIDNPVLATALLLAVAAGMIAHSLRYRMESLTGVAFISAFAALAVTPSATLAVVAVVPLAAVLLWISARFRWHRLSVTGLVATYATCVAHGSSQAPLWQSQALFVTYWAIFEAFDLLRVHRRDLSSVAAAIFPLNAAGFLALSFSVWLVRAPADAWQLSALAAALYLGSALARAALSPRGTAGEDPTALERLQRGSYEAPMLLAAVLAALAIAGRVPGIWMAAGLALEAELLLLAGVRFRQPFLRGLAAAAFALSLARWMLNDAFSGATTPIIGRPVHNATPVALLHAALFYANQALRAAPPYVYLATALAAAALAYELPFRGLGLAWLGYGLLLLEIGMRRGLRHWRWQGFGMAALGGIAAAFVTPLAGPWRWLPSAAALSIAYPCALRALRLPDAMLPAQEREWLRWGASLGASASAALLLARLAPFEYTGVAWVGLSVLLFELALRGLPPELRVQSYLLAAGASVAVVATHFEHFKKFAGLPVWGAFAGAALGLAAFAARGHFARLPGVRDVASAAALLFAMAASWIVAPDVVVAMAWAALALAAAEISFPAAAPVLGRTANAVAIAAFVRLFFANFTNLGETFHISHRLLSVLPVSAVLLYLWRRFGADPDGRRFARWHLWAAVISTFVLLRFELGRTPTAAGWAGLALVVYYLGLRRADWDFRWQAYAIALAAFLRGWTTGFQIPDSFGGMPARVLTAAAVIAAFYAAQLLTPRTPPADATAAEVHARTYFSVLATVLLTALLFHEISGSLLTIAWGLEGVALLLAGFPLRDRLLRLSGLALLLACILKLFLYDLRNLDTLYRILSFIGLGVILLSVSWLYTRFRERIRQYL